MARKRQSSCSLVLEYVHVYRPADDSRTQGHFRGPSPQDVALRVLVRIQAYMLADIVVAILR